MLNISRILLVVNMAMSILSAGSWGLILAAIFGERHTLSSLNLKSAFAISYNRTL
jgi:hypothetical protein